VPLQCAKKAETVETQMVLRKVIGGFFSAGIIVSEALKNFTHGMNFTHNCCSSGSYIGHDLRHHDARGI
jgi:hypothetical protein